MYTLKSIAQRSTMLGAVFALVAAAFIPAAAVFADSLNPLTERSLLLTSSAPGFQDSDGAGNSESNPNAYDPDGAGPTPAGEYYAPPGSGPNGKKSGQTFTFRVSTDSFADPTNKTLRAFSLQYCTTAAGNCQAPGNNAGDARSGAGTPRMGNAAAHALPDPKSDFDVVTDATTPWGEGNTEGTYQVLVNGAPASGWAMSTVNAEDTAHSGALTGKQNMIYLTKATGIAPAFNDKIEVRFRPNTKNYITNPGAGSFFVKINTYNTATVGSLIPTVPSATNANIIDGGVTVANVMTDSIHITTKVLETMAFSVGTQNPDTQPVQHASCEAMTALNNNRLNLGNPDAENSLETGKTWDVNSYWRLSSNSSGGATVYYSGDTLRNTVGDYIADMPLKAHSQSGTEQFGLALVDAGLDTMDGGTFPANHRPVSITPLAVEAPYAEGGDGLASELNDSTTSNNAQFAFKKTSQTVPEVIAQNGDSVISCATAKVRYIGNIAADTPAGVYTTKINYLAAPQY